MSEWIVAGVQMDVRLGDLPGNLERVVERLHAAADRGARLIVFPECALTGYCFTSRAEVAAVAEPAPGPATDAIAAACARRDVFALVGLLESTADGRLFNSAALIGPAGLVANYRKIHLPCVGADRFVDPGDQLFTTHDLGGLNLGIGICFDGSFPEASRTLTLLGADLIALPTNWADAATKMADLVCRVRALENHVYFLAVNRVGDEGGFHFIGRTSLCDFAGDFVARADHDGEEIVLGTVDPAAARKKKVVVCAGEYEIDRVNWRRPEFYHALTAPREPTRDSL
jgi:predicted amidohydrolase